jgi:glyoxylase-like metal-dependent hydrolase (beta-lactamase superfamily II)
VLVDAGPDYRGAWDELRTTCGPLPDLVIATHGHLDHAGLGAAWQEAGVPVALAPADAHLAHAAPLTDAAELARFEGFVQRSGAPADVCASALAALQERSTAAVNASTAEHYPPAPKSGHWATALRYKPFVPALSLPEGDFGDSGIEIVACPGHTPGNVVVLLPEEGFLFSGDQLLPDLTPTPAVQSQPHGTREGDWRFRSLPAFRASMAKLQTRAFTRCYPGHGAAFDDVAGHIEANLAVIDQRTERVHAELREGGPASIWALAERIYPRAVRRRFWQIIATIQGHVDILVESGRAVETEAGYAAL